jgi:hypothetical protein
MLNRRNVIVAGAAVLGAAVHAPALAQAYPSKPVRLIVPSRPAARPTSSRGSWPRRSTDRSARRLIYDSQK